jgi:hypothetical protein
VGIYADVLHIHGVPSVSERHHPRRPDTGRDGRVTTQGTTQPDGSAALPAGFAGALS